MTTLYYEIKIDAPPQEVWDILADFGGIYKYNPSVSQSYSTSPANSGLGATRHCDLRPTGTVEERIIAWNEGHDYKVDIFEGKGVPPFRSSIAHLVVEPDRRGTKASMRLDYSLKYGVLGKLMDKLVVKSQFSKAIPGILAGLKHYSETGEPVEKGVRLDRTTAVPVAA